MKIIDKINAMAEDECFYSYEYFPPKTDSGIVNLFQRIDRMAATQPLFVDCTWGAGGSTSEKTLEICKTVQQYMGVDIMMHLTCTNMDVQKLYDALNEAKKFGIMNILALRGDPPAGQEWTACQDGFSNAVHLVEYIRKEHGDYFGIGVAGYPEGHLDAESYEKDLQYCKEKIDAGADFIVTQLFYDTDCFHKYVDDCRAIGITCPILPGLLPIQSVAAFNRMIGFCKTAIPDWLSTELEKYKDDDAACKKFGVELAVKMCNEMKAKGTRGFHFYTLNLEKSALAIVEELGLYTPAEAHRDLPWRQGAGSMERVNSEQVRPIFWANRPRSYLTRTSAWDEFPNGRWGDSSSPAYGDLSEYYLSRLSTGNTGEKKIKMWGVPASAADVSATFVKFCKGEVNLLPWSESPMQIESEDINEQLVSLNSAGVLTINSQPQVNAAPSTDKAYGWGGPGGYVYQKGYLEFFASPELTQLIVKNCDALPSISYTAMDKSGTRKYTNATSAVNAVTWGVFPQREVIQPTVVSTEAFMVWKDEAFDLWSTEWASAYTSESAKAATVSKEDTTPLLDEAAGAAAVKVLEEMAETYFLVTIVENDYIGGDVFRAFAGIVDVAVAEETADMVHSDGTAIKVSTTAAGTTTTITHCDGTVMSTTTSP